jgi:hypothetical protein
MQLATANKEWVETNEYWHTRVWTFQGRLLSRRRLVSYKNTMKWECGTDTWYELVRSLERDYVQQLRVKEGPDWVPTELVGAYA